MSLSLPEWPIIFPMQVMALIAYLMEFKGNYGPHLIIVPNAVLVNWKVSIFSDTWALFKPY